MEKTKESQLFTIADTGPRQAISQEDLRKIRQESGAKLVKARQELREVLTLRQEKILVMTGWLD